MNAGFWKRAFSSVVDASLILLIIYLTFLAFGRKIITNQITNFDNIYSTYQEISSASNANLSLLADEYNAAIVNADGDSDLEDAAQATYVAKKAVISDQRILDIAPYNTALTMFLLYISYYYIVGFLLLLTVYVLAMKGYTLGRRLMQVKLEGPVHAASIFFHDVILKYFFVAIALMLDLRIGILFIATFLIIDLITISFTGKKVALRDMILKMRVVTTGYKY